MDSSFQQNIRYMWERFLEPNSTYTATCILPRCLLVQKLDTTHVNRGNFKQSCSLNRFDHSSKENLDKMHNHLNKHNLRFRTTKTVNESHSKTEITELDRSINGTISDASMINNETLPVSANLPRIDSTDCLIDISSYDDRPNCPGYLHGVADTLFSSNTNSNEENSCVQVVHLNTTQTFVFLLPSSYLHALPLHNLCSLDHPLLSSNCEPERVVDFTFPLEPYNDHPRQLYVPLTSPYYQPFPTNSQPIRPVNFSFIQPSHTHQSLSSSESHIDSHEVTISSLEVNSFSSSSRGTVSATHVDIVHTTQSAGCVTTSCVNNISVHLPQVTSPLTRSVDERFTAANNTIVVSSQSHKCPISMENGLGLMGSAPPIYLAAAEAFSAHTPISQPHLTQSPSSSSPASSCHLPSSADIEATQHPQLIGQHAHMSDKSIIAAGHLPLHQLPHQPFYYPPPPVPSMNAHPHTGHPSHSTLHAHSMAVHHANHPSVHSSHPAHLAPTAPHAHHTVQPASPLIPAGYNTAINPLTHAPNISSTAGMTIEESGMMTNEQLRMRLQYQLEYYFSRENLSNDTYLMSQMDADQYVPIQTVAKFNQVKRLTNNIDLITQVLCDSPHVQVDPSGTRVRPNHKRCTVILREVADNTTAAEIKEMFKNMSALSRIVSVENARVNNTWYVNFESDEHAQSAYRYLREEVQLFKGSPIMARIKAQPIVSRMSYGMVQPVIHPPVVASHPAYQLSSPPHVGQPVLVSTMEESGRQYVTSDAVVPSTQLPAVTPGSASPASAPSLYHSASPSTAPQQQPVSAHHLASTSQSSAMTYGVSPANAAAITPGLIHNPHAFAAAAQMQAAPVNQFGSIYAFPHTYFSLSPHANFYSNHVSNHSSPSNGPGLFELSSTPVFAINGLAPHTAFKHHPHHPHHAHPQHWTAAHRFTSPYFHSPAAIPSAPSRMPSVLPTTMNSGKGIYFYNGFGSTRPHSSSTSHSTVTPHGVVSAPSGTMAAQFDTSTEQLSVSSGHASIVPLTTTCYQQQTVTSVVASSSYLPDETTAATTNADSLVSDMSKVYLAAAEVTHSGASGVSSRHPSSSLSSSYTHQSNYHHGMHQNIQQQTHAYHHPVNTRQNNRSSHAKHAHNSSSTSEMGPPPSEQNTSYNDTASHDHELVATSSSFLLHTQPHETHSALIYHPNYSHHPHYSHHHHVPAHVTAYPYHPHQHQSHRTYVPSNKHGHHGNIQSYYHSHPYPQQHTHSAVSATTIHSLHHHSSSHVSNHSLSADTVSQSNAGGNISAGSYTVTTHTYSSISTTSAIISCVSSSLSVSACTTLSSASQVITSTVTSSGRQNKEAFALECSMFPPLPALNSTSTANGTHTTANMVRSTNSINQSGVALSSVKITQISSAGLALSDSGGHTACANSTSSSSGRVVTSRPHPTLTQTHSSTGERDTHSPAHSLSSVSVSSTPALASHNKHSHVVYNSKHSRTVCSTHSTVSSSTSTTPSSTQHLNTVASQQPASVVTATATSAADLKRTRSTFRPTMTHQHYHTHTSLQRATTSSGNVASADTRQRRLVNSNMNHVNFVATRKSDSVSSNTIVSSVDTKSYSTDHAGDKSILVSASTESQTSTAPNSTTFDKSESSPTTTCHMSISLSPSNRLTDVTCSDSVTQQQSSVAELSSCNATSQTKNMSYAQMAIKGRSCVNSPHVSSNNYHLPNVSASTQITPSNASTFTGSQHARAHNSVRPSPSHSQDVCQTSVTTPAATTVSCVSTPASHAAAPWSKSCAPSPTTYQQNTTVHTRSHSAVSAHNNQRHAETARVPPCCVSAVSTQQHTPVLTCAGYQPVSRSYYSNTLPSGGHNHSSYHGYSSGNMGPGNYHSHQNFRHYAPPRRGGFRGSNGHMATGDTRVYNRNIHHSTSSVNSHNPASNATYPNPSSSTAPVSASSYAAQTGHQCNGSNSHTPQQSTNQRLCNSHYSGNHGNRSTSSNSAPGINS